MHSNRGRFARAMIVATVTLGLVGSANAVVDLSGDYRVDDTNLLMLPDVCTMNVAQAGTAISLTQSCLGATAGTASGTIDPNTGAFTVSGTCTFDSGNEHPYSLDGQGAADSLTIELNGLCNNLPVGMFATKCGNGVLDTNEVCEDGNRDDGDCCSASCAADPAGTLCYQVTSPICTQSACDGAGSCAPAFLTSPSGSFCDLDADVCTIDECDGAGSCLATGGSQTCDSCSVCDPGAGCVGDTIGLASHPPGCVRSPGGRDMVRVFNRLTNDERDRVIWKWRHDVADPIDFGDPTSTTDYQLCVFRFDPFGGVFRTVTALDIPAGAGWSATSNGFRHKSKTASGSRKVKLATGSDPSSGRILVKGKGLQSGVSSDLGLFPSDTIRVELRASNGMCWGASHVGDVVRKPRVEKLLGD